MLHFFLVILFGLLPMWVGQTTDEMVKDINKAVETGNSRTIARYFGQNVELNIPGSEGTFSRAQSEIILREFFSRNAPDQFTVNRQGAARDGSLFVIGTLKAKDGNTYRTYYLIKRVSQSYFLHQVHIEPR